MTALDVQFGKLSGLQCLHSKRHEALCGEHTPVLLVRLLRIDAQEPSFIP